MTDKEDRQAFLDAMAGVRPLQDKGRANLHKPQNTINQLDKSRKRHAAQTEYKTHTISKVSDELNKGLHQRQFKQLKRGDYAPQADVDLHGCNQHEAIILLNAILQEARRYDYRVICIIHGKGLHSGSQGTLKTLTRNWLQTQSDVLAYCSAPVAQGGYGATYVYLKT